METEKRRQEQVKQIYDNVKSHVELEMQWKESIKKISLGWYFSALFALLLQTNHLFSLFGIGFLIVSTWIFQFIFNIYLLLIMSIFTYAFRFVPNKYRHPIISGIMFLSVVYLSYFLFNWLF